MSKDHPHLSLKQRDELSDLLIKEMLERLSMDDAITVMTTALNKLTNERAKRRVMAANVKS